MADKVYKRALIIGGAFLTAAILLVTGIIFFGGSAHASANTPNSGTPLSVKQEESAAEDSTEEDGTEEDGTEEDVETNIRINEKRVRWTGDKWEYSTDGGQTWTDTPPDGVRVGEDGDLTVWQGEGDIEDFDYDAFRQEVDDMIESTLSEVYGQMENYFPEGLEEGTSYFNYGDTIARKRTDGVWEFSSDDGETWTTEPPEGIEVSEDGTRIRFGGGEGDIDNFDIEEWYENWYNEWSNEWNGGASTTGTTQDPIV